MILGSFGNQGIGMGGPTGPTTEFIPYSPPNGPEPDPNARRIIVAGEVKRRHGFYQDLVDCPGQSSNLFDVGMNSWLSGRYSVEDKLDTTWDVMSNQELFGLLFPVLGVGVLGYLAYKGLK